MEVCNATISAFHTRTFRPCLANVKLIGDANDFCALHTACCVGSCFPKLYNHRILWLQRNFQFRWRQPHLNKTERSRADRSPFQPRNIDIQKIPSIDTQWLVRYSRQTPRRLIHRQPLSRSFYLNQLDVTVCRTLR